MASCDFSCITLDLNINIDDKADELIEKASHDGSSAGAYKETSNNNQYQCGIIKGPGGKQDHYVIICRLPAGRTGVSPAATVARDMQRSFPELRFGLLVGIGGGVPGKGARLGDVVVSQPTDTHGGAIQHDYGKNIQSKEFKRMG
ncbi:MAG: hypothetical protein M1834_007062 [Cirrosporium novae-zelandiae]|nr:MAG: hypothetical protein M1834_007062 [Cirrosporium novae-zelandiae]